MTDARADTLLPQVRELVAKVLVVSVDRVQPDLSLVNDLGAESIDLMELCFYLEDAFGIDLDDLELRSLGESQPDEVAALTARRVAALVSAKLAAQA